MSAALRALIEQARSEHQRCACDFEHTEDTPAMCVADGGRWPCLTARLAGALEQESARASALAQQLSEEQMRGNAICQDWSDRLDAAEAEHHSCATFLEDAQIQLSLAQDDLGRTQVDLVQWCEVITTYVEALAASQARAERELQGRLQAVDDALGARLLNEGVIHERDFALARAERLADRLKFHATARHNSAFHYGGGASFETCQILECRDDRAALGLANGEDGR